MRLTNRLRARFQSWLAERTPRKFGVIELHRRRVYILPTRGGFYFGLLVCVMLMGSMNYSNSLGFALTFLLAGLGFVSMHHSHRNLVNLRLRARRSAPIFAGNRATFPVILFNPGAATRYTVYVDTGEDGGRPMDIPAGGEALMHVTVPAPRRGRLICPRLRIHTQYPMGLFRAWAWAAPDRHCLVYPQPAGELPLPAPGAGAAAGRAALQSGREDFVGLRRYVRGDPPRQIHWKAYSHSGQLMSKLFADPRENTLWLDAANLVHLPLETCLSQLTRWVLLADRHGLVYGLRLPRIELTPAAGGAQRERCLRALALYDDAT
jgi:uncharacterized protein (DUF58 family)